METNRQILFQKLLVILQRCLVQTRNLAPVGQQIHDLADTFEIVPEMMLRWQAEDFDRVREILASYQAKYPGTAFDYLSILDMDDVDFQAVYGLPEEAAVAPVQGSSER